MKTFSEFVNENLNEGILSKINNWFKNIDLVKMTREHILMGKYDKNLKVYPSSIKFLREDNGWNYYSVNANNKTYLCFLSSSDDDLVKQFKKETDGKGSETFWLSLGKIDDMEQNGVVPYYIAELTIDGRI
jgi:hypothetical protein